MGDKLTHGVGVPLLMLLLAALIAGCGGAGTTTPDSTALGSQDQAASGSDGLFSGIPGIPIDGAEPFKVSSGDGDPPSPGDPPPPPPPPGVISVLGSEYLVMEGGYVDGTALVLGDDERGSDMRSLGPGNDVAYGMYKIGGIADMRPESLNIECIPQELGDRYYVGVANYSDMHWDWFGPVTFPEFQLELMDSGHQYVTHLGNLYFILICTRDNIVRHERSSLVLGPQSPPRPGAPTGLQASDGAFPEMIEVTWLPGRDAHFYEVWRAGPIFGGGGGDPDDPGDPNDPPGDPGDPPNGGGFEWMLIAETPDTLFHDFVPPDLPFAYRVRAVNPAGVSEFSNDDVGFAAGGPPPGGCVVDGIVFARTSPTGPDYPLPGVRMWLSGYPQEILVFTNEEGYFRFEGVPEGLHMLAPVNFEHVFDPPYVPVELYPTPDGVPCQVTVTFEGHPTDAAHRRCWGFVHQSNSVPGGAGPGWVGMPGVEVWATHEGPLDVAFGGVTDGNGFFAFDIGNDGPYRLRPWAEGYQFNPGEVFFSIPLPNPGSPEPPYVFHGEPGPLGD